MNYIMSQQVLDDYLMLVKKMENHEPFAFGHFNDGEMRYVLDFGKDPISRGDQDYDENLTTALRNSFLLSNPNFYRGIPCVKCFPEMHKKTLIMIEGRCDIPTTTACIFHHTYVAHRDKMLKTFSTYPRVTWITNQNFALKHVCSKIGLDFLKCRHINVPSKNGWNSYQDVSKLEYMDGELVILLCGPLGRVLAGEEFTKWPNTTFLCIGSYFDSIAGNRTHSYHHNNRLCSECCPP